MGAITASRTSAASPDRLWSLISDLPAWGEMLPTVRSVEALDPAVGPIGVGSRFTVRQPGLPTAVYEVTEWAPGCSFTWVSRGPGLLATAVHTVEPVDSGSRLDLSLEWTGPLAGPLRLLLARKARGMVELEAETFTRLAETGR